MMMMTPKERELVVSFGFLGEPIRTKAHDASVQEWKE